MISLHLSFKRWLIMRVGPIVTGIIINFFHCVPIVDTLKTKRGTWSNSRAIGVF